MKILIVDDNPDSVKSASMFLELCGFKVEPAYSGTGAQTLMGHIKFDVVLIDYRINDLTGLEVLRWMRGEKMTTPAIITTGVDQDVVDAIKKCVEDENLGPAVVLGKPYDSEVLLNSIGVMAATVPGNSTTITHTTASTVTVSQAAK